MVEGFKSIQVSVHWSQALRLIEEYGQHASFVHFPLGGDSEMAVLKHSLTQGSSKALLAAAMRQSTSASILPFDATMEPKYGS